jgi:predicted extracellular nuclease
MAKAKTASKNNPTTREKAKDIFYNGQKIKPVKIIGENSTYIAAQYESGEVIEDAEGNALAWKEVAGS